jgi:hypothetical protein
MALRIDLWTAERILLSRIWTEAVREGNDEVSSMVIDRLIVTHRQGPDGFDPIEAAAFHTEHFLP